MWYLGLGSGVELTRSEVSFLEEMAYYLALAGWSLRSGGRGPVDDAMIQGALSFARGFSVEVPAKYEVILPHSQYRSYTADNEHVFAYSQEPQKIRAHALALGERYCRKTQLRSRFQQHLLGSGAMLAFGRRLDTPVKFAVTLNRESISDRGRLYEGNRFSYEANLHRLLKAYRIPLFNVSDDAHRERILSFIQQQRTLDASRHSGLGNTRVS